MLKIAVAAAPPVPVFYPFRLYLQPQFHSIFNRQRPNFQICLSHLRDLHLVKPNRLRRYKNLL